jgi:hypothetical protein
MNMVGKPSNDNKYITRNVSYINNKHKMKNMMSNMSSPSARTLGKKYLKLLAEMVLTA